MKAAEKAYGVLHRGIIEGRFAPGTRITEGEVAARAGVSRTPVREALRRLAAEGLVRFVPHQGAFVNAWSDADAADIFDLRALLEGFAARLCAERAPPELKAELRSLAAAQLRESRGRRAGRLERIADLNTRFHHLLRAGAASPRLDATLAALINAPLILQTFRDYSREELIRSATHHLELVDAIDAGDGGWADTVMRAHVMAARRVFFTRHA